MCYIISVMTRKKENFTYSVQRKPYGSLSGLQLYLFPEMNDTRTIINYFSAMWQARRKQHPEFENELQQLGKRQYELKDELVQLYKEQEESENEVVLSDYWYNNIESRDLEPEPVEINYTEQRITSINTELANIKKRTMAIINQIYPEHRVFQELVRASTDKTL